jgi:alkanesulfonate monooxygenase SsuD/methylene tetrahydromethanopterin reductase-like flavin-dependent oxidoreductase (luciferase family)
MKGMKVGIGMSPHIPEDATEWARRTEAGPFSTLGVLDRLVYFAADPLITLAAAAAVTSRIRLQTEVLLAPLRNTAILAKEVASLDRISGGRVVLGLGVGNYRGARFDDYHAAGMNLRTRGQRLDRQITEFRQIWSGLSVDGQTAPIGPLPAQSNGPEILLGAFSPRAIARIARWGTGFLAAGPPNYVAFLIGEVRREWEAAGRSGMPRIVVHCYVAIGNEEVIDDARATLVDYYSYLDDDARRVADYMVTTPMLLRTVIAQYKAMGADEVICFCWGRDVGQVDRIADVLAGIPSPLE